MSARTTTIISKRDVTGSAGTVMLAALGLGAGLLLIDHAYSAKGRSALDRFVGKMKDGHFFTGADASDVKKLPAYAQQVIAHAIAAETDSATLSSLADNLQAAGFAQTAAQVRAKVHG